MIALAMLLVLAADADAPRTWAVTDASTLSYHLVHKLHSVDGVARAVEGRARLLPDGGVQVAIRARVAAFDSGNANRDAHMQEVTDAARFPFVLFKGVASGVRIEGFPAELQVPLRGVLEFHGVTRELEVTARVRFPSAARAEVEATFPVSLTAHGVERPSLLFIPVDDRLDVTARLALSAEEP